MGDTKKQMDKVAESIENPQPAGTRDFQFEEIIRLIDEKKGRTNRHSEVSSPGENATSTNNNRLVQAIKSTAGG